MQYRKLNKNHELQAKEGKVEQAREKRRWTARKERNEARRKKTQGKE